MSSPPSLLTSLFTLSLVGCTRDILDATLKNGPKFGHVCIIQLQHLSLLEVTTLDSNELNEIITNEWVEKPKTFRAQAGPPHNWGHLISPQMLAGFVTFSQLQV